MVSQSDHDRQMTFIDFEYADWAPRGFDLGNHFCEYAGFDGDYSKYPTDSSEFVREYLTVFNGRKPVRE
jgi:ethanolamine kinase